MSNGGSACVSRLSPGRQGYVVEVSVVTFQSQFVLQLATDVTDQAAAIEQARLWVQQLGEPFTSSYGDPGSLKEIRSGLMTKIHQ